MIMNRYPDLDIDEERLDKRLKALTQADIIVQGETNARYHAVKDNFFDKVFRGAYQEDIDDFLPEQIHREHQDLAEQSNKEFQRKLGKWSYNKGLFAEFLILRCFQHQVNDSLKKNQLFCSITQNLPKDFRFCRYSSVWSYSASPETGRDLQVDLLARATDPENYSVIGEIKNRSSIKFSLAEAKAFQEKFKIIQQEENISKAIAWVFSRKGFYKNAEAYLKQQNIAYSDDERWLDGK